MRKITDRLYRNKKHREAAIATTTTSILSTTLYTLRHLNSEVTRIPYIYIYIRHNHSGKSDSVQLPTD